MIGFRKESTMRECQPLYWQFPVALEWEEIHTPARYDARLERFREFTEGLDLRDNRDYIRHRSAPKEGSKKPLDAIAFKTKAMALQFKMFMQGMY